MKHRLRRLLLGLCLLLMAWVIWVYAAPNPAPNAPEIGPEMGRVTTNLTYCRGGAADLKLDLYQPQPLEGRPAPVAVYLHGGGWQEGDKTWIGRILPAPALTARGYAVAAVDYRLAPRYPWPAPIQDAKCAVRFLRSHAAQYGLDPGHIGVWGDSAGGHLAALLGLAGSYAGLEGDGGQPGVSSAVQAVVTMSAPTDYTTLDLTPANRVMAQALLGHQPDAALLQAVSPVSYARADAPPFLILHGTADTLVPPAHAQALYDALRRVGAPVTLTWVQHGGHVFAPTDAPPQPSIAAIDAQVLDFFATHLGQPASVRHFPTTGKTVRGPLLAYWDTHGGLLRFGYPISEPLTEAPTPSDPPQIVQYFQRAVLTWQPTPAGGSVTSLPLGHLRWEARAATPLHLMPNAPSEAAFATTARQFDLGAPLSPLLSEPSDLDGHAYPVQYYAAALLEYHADQGQAVLAQLGTLRWRARYGSR